MLAPRAYLYLRVLSHVTCSLVCLHDLIREANKLQLAVSVKNAFMTMMVNGFDVQLWFKLATSCMPRLRVFW